MTAQNTMQPLFYQRDFSGEILPLPGLRWSVERYSFATIGGPDRLTLKATGRPVSLWELVETLRCPIEIFDPIGRCVWWGLAQKVTLRDGRFEFGADLSGMNNRVAVAYSYVEPGAQLVGQRKTTAYAADAEAAGEYGYKDLQVSLGGATDAQALQVRGTVLAQNRLPNAWLRRAGGQGATQATIEGVGWWKTLEWRMLKVTTTNNVATTTQIANAITAVGSFFAGTDIETASGISTSEYRDGDTTALAEIEELLRSGTSGQQRLMASVTRERRVVIKAEPTLGSADYTLDRRGRVRDESGNRLINALCPAGLWMRVTEVIPGSADISKLAQPGVFFVESAEYTPKTNEYLPTPRGAPTPWDIIRRFVK